MADHPSPRGSGLLRYLSMASARNLLFALAPLAAAAAPDGDPWAAALSFNNIAAIQSFEAARKAAPADPRLMLGHASALLNRQPTSPANIKASADLLHAVDANPQALATHRATARYLLARIAQDHLAIPDLDAARQHYRTVMRDFPAHPLAGQAAVNLGYILRWSTPGLAPAEIAEGLEQLLTETTAPTARRELLFLLGELRRRDLDDKKGARDALIVARAIGFESPGRNGDIDLLIASLSRDLNDSATALAHYRAFARDYPRDGRAATVRRLASELEPGLAAHP